MINSANSQAFSAWLSDAMAMGTRIGRINALFRRSLLTREDMAISSISG
ncbi:hypothetical protein ACCUM_4018 [Candidatus Accumulibacter phosphatis]|uniref:Uncharacterized protein n=1 Tax=Candidatus Accumulibacter phosphatis TaxID=327160 RepID=A0A5S4EMX1_9PROT|nr:hypothetical protein ACCUM_4018 [Candidatus Accumulibacter phosphatis]